MKRKASKSNRIGKSTARQRRSTSNKTASTKSPKAAKGRSSIGVTRTEAILSAVRQSGGVSITELAEFTGWQAHSIRSALSRLRQAGHAITSVRRNGTYRYHAEVKR